MYAHRTGARVRQPRWRAVLPWLLAALLALSALLLSGAEEAHAAGFVGPKHYYLALGDSLAFGFQPNLDWSDGYATDWANHMRATGTALDDYDNLACPGESTATFLHGGCPYWYLRKYPYLGSQMSAALSFLGSHAGQVSPVSLDIGANDLLACYSGGAINATCATSALNAVAVNLPVIVAGIKQKLAGTGDFFLMNYYDPYQNSNPATLYWVNQLNALIGRVGAAYGVPVVNVAGIFDMSSYPNGGNPVICSWTWICSFYHDIHPTNSGYAAIAGGFETLSGY